MLTSENYIVTVRKDLLKKKIWSKTMCDNRLKWVALLMAVILLLTSGIFTGSLSAYEKNESVDDFVEEILVTEKD